MNKLAKQYVKEAKAFFPIVRKQEKKYLEHLENTVDEYCQRRFDVLSMEKLYTEFGEPSAVAHEYFSGLDMNFILKKINLKRSIKGILITSCIVGLAIISIYLLNAHKLLENQLKFSEDYISNKTGDE